MARVWLRDEPLALAFEIDYIELLARSEAISKHVRRVYGLRSVKERHQDVAIDTNARQVDCTHDNVDVAAVRTALRRIVPRRYYNFHLAELGVRGGGRRAVLLEEDLTAQVNAFARCVAAIAEVVELLASSWDLIGVDVAPVVELVQWQPASRQPLGHDTGHLLGRRCRRLGDNSGEHRRAQPPRLYLSVAVDQTSSPQPT